MDIRAALLHTTDANRPAHGQHIGQRVSSVRLEGSAPQGTYALLAMQLTARPRYVAGILAAAALAAFALTAGRYAVPALVKEADAAVTLMLAGPTLFAGIIASPARGGVGAQLLWAARAVLRLTGLLVFAAAVALVVVQPAECIKSVWLVLAAGCWLSTLVLVVGLMSPGTHIRLRRIRSSEQPAVGAA
ncbi:hypothetical protein [Solirubrobacter pauli]|uniref:hypothetical protein n=1 Tax=Solirubrobacter pauli TaxID=166793 RepID=UPI000EAEC776|nr:hypothetical protein [Solirubrobacter pauli]